MYHTTGFTKDQITEVCALITAAGLEPGINHWSPIQGLFKAVTISLAYPRSNHVQAELAETSAYPSPRSATHHTYDADHKADALPYVPAAEDLDHGTQYIADGTLLPYWSWHDHPDLYSGKHKATGVNVQVACDLYG